MSWRKKDFKINIYVCKGCKYHMVTVDVAKGVTPMLATCPECDGTNQSSLYPRIRPVPMHIGRPTHEWYKPQLSSIKNVHDRDHVRRGGLLLRPIQTPKSFWCYHV